MACGSCGGRKAATNDYLVTVDGEETRHPTVAAARMWIAREAVGKRATIKSVPKLKP